MLSIFISYNRMSEAVAKNLINDIKLLGHDVWFDQELSGGQAWWDQILLKIRECDLFVFILNPESLNSTPCKLEFSYADSLGKSILPVIVSGEISPALLPPALSQIQFVDYKKMDRDAAFSLARALGSISPPRPLPDPLPEAPQPPISYIGSLAEQIETTSDLSYEKQCALLVDLKRGLRCSRSTDDTRTLLKRLRKRNDLFASIGEEIDELMVSTKKLESNPSSVSCSNPSSSNTKLNNHKPTKKSGKKVFGDETPQNAINPSEPTDNVKKSIIKRLFKIFAVLFCIAIIIYGAILMNLSAKGAISELSAHRTIYFYSELVNVFYIGIFSILTGLFVLFFMITRAHRSKRQTK
jgi:hypothetical protein